MIKIVLYESRGSEVNKEKADLANIVPRMHAGNVLGGTARERVVNTSLQLF